MTTEHSLSSVNPRREVRFEAGYDHRAEDADKPAGRRRGCHGLQIRFLLHGDEGVVQFLMYTDWLPSDVGDGAWGPKVDRSIHDHRRLADLMPMAADLGQHWKTPLYDGNYTMECDVLPDGVCHYDGSGLNAEPVMAALFTGGSDAVWKLLEEHYEYCQTTAAEHAASAS